MTYSVSTYESHICSVYNYMYYSLLCMNAIFVYLSFFNFQEIGFVNVGLKYEHASGRLTVKVDEAKSLQHHPITGPPSKRTMIYVFRIVYSRVL